MSKFVRDAMTTNPVVCPPDATLDQVATLMVQHNCGAIPIIDLMERPLGIVTDRDIISRIVAQGKNPLAYPVDVCMSRPVVTVPADAPIEDVLTTMDSRRVRRLPVVDDDGRCIGIISDADVRRALESAAPRSR